MNAAHCPALFVAGVASNQGKTTLTAGLARYHRDAGRRVRVFKVGPDFLDPTILEHASGAPVYQLDLWMVGETHCRHLLHGAAQEADLILVEGAMGLFDGTPSGADLAQRFGIPALVVIDATAMAQTFGAVVHGLRHYRPELPFAGVVANRVAGDCHRDLVAEGMPEDVPLLAVFDRDPDTSLPARHLGLVQASEVDDLELRLNRIAARIQGTSLTALPQPCLFEATAVESQPTSLSGVRIAVARDAAFGFIYPANLDLLESLGATVVEFSPLNDDGLPEEIDALWIPGGYPELHLERLQENRAMAAAITAHHRVGKPILAECGGMLYLLENLTDKQGNQGRMCGLLPGSATMRTRLTNLGMHSLELPQGTLRGHTFHHSTTDTLLTPTGLTRPQRLGTKPEAYFRQGGLHAGYVHHYFASNPAASAVLFTPKYNTT
uniref:Hydrogenobyrinic acid a,c-diamide synthase (Glutamine-hydrolysing) /cobyrinate a,c-diamide synthase n=1 Tax=Candidatus Kentrum sp. TUN TaxID=2126343 RepID=A0A450ZIP7_9GAMM|nr:MAG: hydrogenobyrinic acid a,c-diamide synthase (glutamine-hydrolysing) /cobyrinate a,c-diamide synthase [Candidatus Kentron sp. TUN]VFK54078.1 MAG: hydrogenobyrinic acid a,c-diamide synthase (glutamine-hydrolysing) /cobyrinate a,c-diamide synthase [Candidatus Kentron sp. TUN]VFK55276.1 MAG: hydrogenobyrinic acid a,c-diamide synthase (glutamine-hydrolysing) /cobyrinate a,c-diamide synthase [Candidatus Kentron sp. TUN]